MFLRKLRWAILVFLGVLGTGVAGFRFLEGWSWFDSLWMVMITLTTIGYGEPHPMTDEGRMFTLGLIVMGVGLGTYTVGQATRYVVEGVLANDLAERRRRRTMKKLENHYIVVGYGRLGKEVAAELGHRRRSVVAIDSEAEAFETASHNLTMQFVGNGSSDELLAEAGIQKAQGLAVATGSEAINIFVTLSARQMNPHLHILTRVDEEADVPKAFRAGANTVINPYGISGARMAQGLLHPHAAKLVDRAIGRAHSEFELEDIAVGEGSSLQGPLGALEIPKHYKVLIVAVQKPDGRLLIGADRKTELKAGDVAVVVGRANEIQAFAKVAHG